MGEEVEKIKNESNNGGHHPKQELVGKVWQKK